MSVADGVAADAWRFAERLFLIGADGLTDAGWRAATLGEAGPPSIRSALAPLLAAAVETQLSGEDAVPIVPLLRRGAQALVETDNLWARQCPGLIPIEVGAIVYWACRPGRTRRASARQHRVLARCGHAPVWCPGPDVIAGRERHAAFRCGLRVLREPLVARRAVPTSFAEDLAMCKLLGYAGYFANSRWRAESSV